jgi:hypothetical protein
MARKKSEETIDTQAQTSVVDAQPKTESVLDSVNPTEGADNECGDWLTDDELKKEKKENKSWGDKLLNFWKGGEAPDVAIDDEGNMMTDRPDLLVQKEPANIDAMAGLLGEFVKSGSAGIDQNQRLVGFEKFEIDAQQKKNGKIDATVKHTRKYRPGLF